MSKAIVREGKTRPRTGRLPIISEFVTHNGLAYFQGVTPEPVGDISTQTEQALQRLDALLSRAGTDKSKLLSVQVWLSDMANFDEHNLAWNVWVDADNAPARACVQSALWRPGLLIEMTAIAAIE